MRRLEYVRKVGRGCHRVDCPVWIQIDPLDPDPPRYCSKTCERADEAEIQATERANQNFFRRRRFYA